MSSKEFESVVETIKQHTMRLSAFRTELERAFDDFKQTPSARNYSLLVRWMNDYQYADQELQEAKTKRRTYLRQAGMLDD